MFVSFRRALSTLATTAIAAGAVIVGAGPAAAHVTVAPEEAEKGGYARLAFRVPNESDTAGTVQVRVMFPTEAPLASVMTKPKDGWKVEVVEKKLPKPVKGKDFDITRAVTSVTWTAEEGVRIDPGEFEEFAISAGPLPSDRSSLSFPAIQTYDDGEVARWTAPVQAGRPEPEHPAPTLTLVEGSGGHHGDTKPDRPAGRAAGQSGQSEQQADQQAGQSDRAGSVSTVDGTARTLGYVGTGMAVLSLLLAGYVLRSSRKGNAA